MIQIKAKPLCNESFRKYGVFQNLLDNESMAKNSVIPAGFFPDLIQLNFGTTTLPSVCCCHITKKDKNIVGFMEAHQYTCEGLLPLDADVIIFVGTLGRGGFSAENLEAFIVPKGTFVKLNPLIVHGSQYCLDTQEAHILCMLPERTYKNDMIAHLVERDEDKAEIVV
ncbi:MAG: hypothetical protein FWH02_05480 [Oscillospiraceae bacterium]|nr:hypothetical protein [Oscillospiraceae bacterium]